MELFRQFEKRDPKKVMEEVKKAYGVSNPEKIHGFAGAFLSGPKDVYLSDRVAKRAKTVKWLNDYLDKCIARFEKDDYGFVTTRESDNNGETRYLSGSSDWMIARYSLGSVIGGIVYASLYDIVLISFIEEDVSDIYEEQFKKCPYCNRGALDDWFLNEIRYVR